MAGFHAGLNFGPSGTDSIPDHYLCQVMWQLFVTGRTKWYLAVLVNGNSLKQYSGERDDNLIRRMAFHANKFWNEYVVVQNPPPLTGADPDSERVKKENPLATDAVLRATVEIEQACESLSAKTAELSMLTVETEGLKNQIKE